MEKASLPVDVRRWELKWPQLQTKLKTMFILNFGEKKSILVSYDIFWSGQWCVSLTPNNTKTIERITCHCFLRPIRKDLTNSSYITALLGMHKNQGRQNEGRRPLVLDKKAMAYDISS